MNCGADAGSEELLDAAEGHGAFGKRYAFDAAHFFVSG